MMRLPVNAGKASTATNFTIAFATFADVIAGICLSFCLLSHSAPDHSPVKLLSGDSSKPSQCLTCYPRDLLAHLLQILRIHSRPHPLQIESTGIVRHLRPRSHT